jgi:hypothetical protein
VFGEKDGPFSEPLLRSLVTYTPSYLKGGKKEEKRQERKKMGKKQGGKAEQERKPKKHHNLSSYATETKLSHCRIATKQRNPRTKKKNSNLEKESRKNQNLNQSIAYCINV